MNDATLEKATSGEPLAVRARARRVELENALARMSVADVSGRADTQHAIATIDSMLSGDVEHLSGATAADLIRVLENDSHVRTSAVRFADRHAEPTD